MMRKIRFFTIFTCIFICLFTTIKPLAEKILVHDQADLLTYEEEIELQKYAETFLEQWNMNFIVVTTDNTNGKSSMEYADDFYDGYFPNNSDKDGVLYLIDMDNREIYLSTCGEAIRYLTNSRIENILDEAFEYVADGDYYNTFTTFFDETEYYLNEGIPSDQYNYDVDTGKIDYYKGLIQITFGELIFAFIIALISSIFTALGIKAKYQLKFEDFQYNAYTDSLANLNIESDQLINSYTTHHRISRNSSYSGGGSSFGGSRSSTHRSSSGRSHGGGGREF